MRDHDLFKRAVLAVAKGALGIVVACVGVGLLRYEASTDAKARMGRGIAGLALADESCPEVQVSCVTAGRTLVVDDTLYSGAHVSLEVRILAEGVDASATLVEGTPLDELLAQEDEAGWDTRDDDGQQVFVGTIVLGEGRHDVAHLLSMKDEEGEDVPVRLCQESHAIRTVVVDETAPSVQIRNLDQGEFLGSPMTIEVVVCDETLGCTALVAPERPLLQLTKDGTVVTAAPLGWEDASVSDTEHTYLVEVPADTGHGDDGSYRLEVTGTDLVENESETMSCDFTVDTTPPELEVTFGGDDSGNEGGCYYRCQRTARIRLAERSFEADELASGTVPVQVEVEARDGRGTSDVLWGPWHCEEGGDELLCEVTFPSNGTYELAVHGTDKAGNALVGREGTEVENGAYASGRFIIDDEPATVKLNYASATPEPHSLAGMDYFKDSVSVEVTVTDRNPDVEHMSVTDSRGREVVPPWSVSERGADGRVVCTATVSYSEDDMPQKAPCVSAPDKAGNRGEGAMESFVVDQTPPHVVRAHVTKEPAAVGLLPNEGGKTLFYNARDGSSPQIVFDASDACALDTAWVADPTGVYSRQMSLARGQESGTVSLPLREPVAEGLRGGAEFVDEVQLFVRDVAGNVCVWTMGDLSCAGLEGSTPHPQALLYDATAPSVRVSGVDPDSFSAAPVTVHVEVDERNMEYLRRYDPGRAVGVVRRRDDIAGEVVAGQVMTAGQLDQRGDSYALDLQLSEDGHYEVEAGLVDYAGNESAVSHVASVTVDTKAPQVQVSWDNTDVRNGQYYRQPRTATLTVVEHNFDPNLVTIQTTGSVGPWAQVGDVHLCQVSFVSDSATESPHTLAVQVSDRAGNWAEALRVPDFVIDTKPPVAVLQKRTSEEDPYAATSELSELRDHTAFSAALEPHVILTDEEGLDVTTVDVCLEGKRGDAVTTASPLTSSPSEREIELVWDNLGVDKSGAGEFYELEADDVYTLTARVCDRAGNESLTEHVTFSVNRFGSTFYVERLGIIRGEELASQTTPLLTEPPLIEIHEVNVSGPAPEQDGSPDASRIVTKEHAHTTQRILLAQEGDRIGYELATSTEQSALNPYEGWSECTYLIREGNFGAGSDSDFGDGGQGGYRVSVTSRDAALNSNTTTSFWGSDKARTGNPEEREVDVAFTLDEQGPSIEDVSLPGTFAWGTSFEAGFRVRDEITEGDRVRVRVDGEPVEVRWADTGEPLDTTGSVAHDGSLAFMVEERPLSVWRSVDIEVVDYTEREDRTARLHAEGFVVTSLALEAGMTIFVLVSIVAAIRVGKRGAIRGAPKEKGM